MSRVRILIFACLLVLSAAALPALAACGDDDNATPSRAAGGSRTSAATKTSKATATKKPQNGGGDTEYYQKLGEILADTETKIDEARRMVDPAGLGRLRWLVLATPGLPEPGWLTAALAGGAEGRPSPD